MENNKIKFVNIQLFAEPTGVETPTNDTQSSEETINYEAEYKKQALEIERLKNAISKTNSENAEYKKREQARLTDDEKFAIELETLRKENATFKLRDSLLSEGYTAKEVEKLISADCSPKAYAEIMNERIKAQEKNSKASAIKTSTIEQSLGSDINKGNEETSYAEKLAKETFASSSNNIKNIYKK